MVSKEPVYFDPGTVNAMKEILDDAWGRIPHAQQATMQKTTLAERLLKLAAQGERDRERLLDAALRDITV